MEGEDDKLSAFDAVKIIAAHNARHLETDSEVEAFLKSWWSRTYNRPLKDPLLQEYTIYELFYEYHDREERALAAQENIELFTDKIETEEEQETLNWIEEEERKEREAEEIVKVRAKKADDKWMLDKLKKEHGDDFGEDVNLDF